MTTEMKKSTGTCTIENAFKKQRLNDADTSTSLDRPNQSNEGLHMASESRETIIVSNNLNNYGQQTSRETERLAVKLNRLHDKRARFQSHEQYMKRCLENNLTPKGLTVYVEPSIGNRDDVFMNKWQKRLEEFSRILTEDVVQFCEEEITKTNKEIKDT